MNMENSGWIKLHRSFLEWEWGTDPIASYFFIRLLFKANWEEKKWQGITLFPGQFVTSLDHLSDETKLSKKVVRNNLNKLIKTGEVGKQTTNKFTIITILNWSKYQNFDHYSEIENLELGTQRAHKGHTKGIQRANDGHQLKNIKKERKKELNKHIPHADAAEGVQNSIFSFSEPEQISAVQMMDSLARWERLLKTWVTQESLVVLKTVRDKHFLKLSATFQEEIVQYVENLKAIEKKFLCKIWIGPLLKSNNFQLTDLQQEIERQLKYDGTRPKSLKQESADEPFNNQDYDENGRPKTNTSKFAFTGQIK